MKMRSLWLAVGVLFSVTGSFATPQGSVDVLPTPTPTPMARPTPPPVVPYEKLIPFLPPVPAGWTAEKPAGSLNEIEVFNLSTASRTYQAAADEDAPVVTVTLIDAGGHKGYFESATGQWKVNAETEEGYDKTVDIDGMPGYEHYSKAAKTGSLSVVVAKRFFIQIEVTNLNPRALQEWFKKIDVKKLAELN